MKLQLSKYLQTTDVIQPLNNLEVALPKPTTELFFYTAVEESQSNVPQTSLEAVLIEEVAIAGGTVHQAQCKEVT